MYSVNGVPLDDPELGWALMRPSRPLGDYSVERASVAAPWRDGVAAGVPGAFAAPTRTLVVQTPQALAAQPVAPVAVGIQPGDRLSLVVAGQEFDAYVQAQAAPVASAAVQAKAYQDAVAWSSGTTSA